MPASLGNNGMYRSETNRELKRICGEDLKEMALQIGKFSIFNFYGDTEVIDKTEDKIQETYRKFNLKVNAQKS